MLIFNSLNGKKICSIFLVWILFTSTISMVDAETDLSITTDRKIYSYGEFLTFTIEVSKVTGEIAILHISDESGKKSSPIPIEINDLKTVVPSPFPFESTTYPVGKFFLEIQYSGNTANDEFELIDSGKVVIPLWIREFSKYWYNGEISDNEYANGIEFLIKEGIIVVPHVSNQETITEVKIPAWVKINTGWWIDGNISDEEYASALEFLIRVGIIVI